MNDVFAKRLVNARKIRCISQRELSSKLEEVVSPSAIAKYEKASMMPSSKVLIEISKVLDFNIDYFFRPFTTNIDSSKFEFRKKSAMVVKKVEAIKALVISKIENYIEIESILGYNTKLVLDFSNISVENESDAIKAAKQFRQNLNIGFDAIVSTIDLLENNGVKIIEIDYDDKFSGTCNMAESIPVIVINKNMSSERKRITIFHELGHLLMHFAEGANKEKLCTIFANEVLIPSEKFTELLGESRQNISLMELRAIQQEYGISVEALMAKALQLNVIKKQRYETFYKKKNALPAFKADVETSLYPNESSSRFKRLVYRALASELISTSKAESLLNIPIDEVRNNLQLL